MNIEHLRDYVVRPVLDYLDIHTSKNHYEAAENLLIATASQESNFKYLNQVGGGPAVGIYQMEPFTHDDIWETYLSFRSYLAEKMRALCLPFFMEDAKEMAGNLYYATGMARVRYLRVKEALPDANDIYGQANYWKKYFNTEEGKGTVDEFVDNYPSILFRK